MLKLNSNRLHPKSTLSFSSFLMYYYLTQTILPIHSLLIVIKEDFPNPLSELPQTLQNSDPKFSIILSCSTRITRSLCDVYIAGYTRYASGTQCVNAYMAPYLLCRVVRMV